MAQYTQHYGLHQWEPGDSFLRTEFNEDLAKIDAALGEKGGACFGSYTGDGGTHTEELGFRPKAVLVCGPSYVILALDGVPHSGLSVSATGFSASYSSGYTFTANHRNIDYRYIAFR